jgi:hypothetical protein
MVWLLFYDKNRTEPKMITPTPIKPDLLGFSGIDVFACGLRDHVITRFASAHILQFFSFFFSVPLSF